jgi:hypothetical protein
LGWRNVRGKLHWQTGAVLFLGLLVTVALTVTSSINYGRLAGSPDANLNFALYFGPKMIPRR